MIPADNAAGLQGDLEQWLNVVAARTAFPDPGPHGHLPQPSSLHTGLLGLPRVHVGKQLPCSISQNCKEADLSVS